MYACVFAACVGVWMCACACACGCGCGCVFCAPMCSCVRAYLRAVSKAPGKTTCPPIHQHLPTYLQLCAFNLLPYTHIHVQLATADDASAGAPPGFGGGPPGADAPPGEGGDAPPGEGTGPDPVCTMPSLIAPQPDLPNTIIVTDSSTTEILIEIPTSAININNQVPIDTPDCSGPFSFFKSFSAGAATLYIKAVFPTSTAGGRRRLAATSNSRGLLQTSPLDPVGACVGLSNYCQASRFCSGLISTWPPRPVHCMAPAHARQTPPCLRYTLLSSVCLCVSICRAQQDSVSYLGIDAVCTGPPVVWANRLVSSCVS